MTIQEEKIVSHPQNFSFHRGWNQVPIAKAAEVRNKIMKTLGITSRPSWLARLRGKTIPRADEVYLIEDVFRAYGIVDIWGEE